MSRRALSNYHYYFYQKLLPLLLQLRLLQWPHTNTTLCVRFCFIISGLSGSIYLSIYLSVCLSVCLSLYLSIYLSISFQENLEVTSLRPWTNQLKLAICIIRKSPKIVWIASRYWKLLLFLLKVNNRNTRTSGEICSKLTIRTLG